jgi:hypothetical protein
VGSESSSNSKLPQRRGALSYCVSHRPSQRSARRAKGRFMTPIKPRSARPKLRSRQATTAESPPGRPHEVKKGPGCATILLAILFSAIPPYRGTQNLNFRMADQPETGQFEGAQMLWEAGSTACRLMNRKSVSRIPTNVNLLPFGSVAISCAKRWTSICKTKSK